MPVLLILASVVILVGVVAVAIGRGGEMAEFAGDYPPFDTDDLLTAADVALLRPPSALWGYSAAATDGPTAPAIDPTVAFSPTPRPSQRRG